MITEFPTKDHADFIQTLLEIEDESQKTYQETNYESCWGEVVFPGNTIVTLERLYSFQNIPADLQKLIESGEAEISPADKKDTFLVRYKIFLSDLHINTDFDVSEANSISNFFSYIKTYQNLAIDDKTKEKVLLKFSERGFYSLRDSLISLFDQGILTKEEREYILSLLLDKGETVEMPDSFSHLDHNLPSENSSQLSRMERGFLLVQMVLRSDQWLDDRQITLDKIELQNLLRVPPSLDFLIPHALLFFDTWEDSRFNNGFIPPGIAMGSLYNFGDSGGRYDIDLPAFGDLVLAGGKALADIVYYDDQAQVTTIDENEHVRVDALPIYAPPNLTNAYVIRIPIITNTIASIEKQVEVIPDSSFKKSRRNSILFDRRDGCISLVLCNSPSRIHPTAIPKALDEVFGKDGWVLVRSVGENSGIKTLKPRPKNEWEVTFGKPKKKVALPIISPATPVKVTKK